MKLPFNRKLFMVGGRVLTIAGGLFVLVLTIAWLSGMFESKIGPGWSESGERRHADEPTDLVHEVTKTYVEEAVGTLKASSRTVVSAKLLATINQIHVKAGDQVKQGQELIRLDDEAQKTRVEQAKQALQASTAIRKQAENDYARNEALVQQNAGSQADFEKATRALQVAKANESKATQAVSESEVMLSFATITAAKNGRIVDRLAEPGDIAKPGEPILVIYDAASLRLEAPVMEQLAVQLTVGDKLVVHVDALNREFQANIDEIVPQANAASRSFLVKASLPRSAELYEGMFGRMRIPSGERRHLCIATNAVVHIGQLEFVDVVKTDGVVERRLIKTGQIGSPGRQEVLSGLEAGEQVILQAAPLATRQP